MRDAKSDWLLAAKTPGLMAYNPLATPPDAVKIERHLENEEATHRLAAVLAQTLRPGLVVYLVGDLGAGKTTLVRGMLRALGYREKVKSPTFTLVELYNVSSLYLYHFDFYRFNHPNEWEDAGFRECFGPTATCLIEWPEKAGARLPRADLRVILRITDAGRDATIEAGTEAGEECLRQLQPSADP